MFFNISLIVVVCSVKNISVLGIRVMLLLKLEVFME